MREDFLKKYPNIVWVKHALFTQDLVGKLRDKDTTSADYADAVRKIGTYFGMCISQNFNLQSKTIQTPSYTTIAPHTDDKILLVPIFRAGQKLAEGFLEFVPDATLGMIGIYNPKDEPEGLRVYVQNLPGGTYNHLVLLDTEIASGQTMVQAVRTLIEKGAAAHDIQIAAILASEPGLKHFYSHSEFADVRIFIADIDPTLNAKQEIVPGIGNSGNRIYNTEPQPEPP